MLPADHWWSVILDVLPERQLLADHSVDQLLVTFDRPIAEGDRSVGKPFADDASGLIGANSLQEPVAKPVRQNCHSEHNSRETTDSYLLLSLQEPRCRQCIRIVSDVLVQVAGDLRLQPASVFKDRVRRR